MHRAVHNLRIAVAAALALATAQPALAEPAAREYQIEVQPLDKALREFALASGLDLLFPPELVEGRTNGQLEGTFSAEAALRTLLRGTGLEFTIDGSRVTITRPLQRQTTMQQQPASSEFLDEIIVTGSRLKRIESEGAVPVVSFDREAIAKVGATDVADVLDYVPQNSSGFAEDFVVGGARQVQLRGLAVGTTLILINGRRVVTSAVQGFRNFFDLNTIPLSAVERVEVLASSASAVYGADAIGGVVNVILRDTVEAPTVDLYYGGADGGGEEMRASLSAGYETDRFRGLFIADYFERDYLLGDERERFHNQDYRRFGGPDARSTASNPGNVFSLGGNLPGLDSNQAGVPVGSTGVGLTAADFIATQGAAGLNRESLRRFNSVVPASTRASAFANLEFDLTSNATLFAEMMYADREESRQLNPTTLSNGSISNTVGARTGIVVPATNPFNPFGVPVRVNYVFEEVGPREELADSEFYRGVLGVEGDVGRWSYEASVLHSGDDATTIFTNEVDPTRVVQALAATDASQALNLFGDGAAGSAELLRSLVGSPLPSSFDSRATQGTAFVSGPLFSMPAGDVQVVLGGEYRREDLDIEINQGLPIVLDADRKSSAAFAEMRVPLISPAMAVPAADLLALTFASRWDDFSDFGDTFNPQFGLEWKPIHDLLVRANWGTSFRPPSLFELYFQGSTQTGQFIDITRPANVPGANGEVVFITLTAGGNPNLDAEEAESYGFGFLYQPSSLPALDVSLDYFNIDQDQRVQSPDAFLLLQSADLFPGRVTRAERTPEDIAAGLPGRLLALDLSRLNLGRQTTQGLDFRSRYRIETGIGEFTPALALTYVLDFESASFPGLPLTERVGVASSEGTVPRVKGVAGLNWSKSGLQIGVSGRYVSSYRDVNLSGVRLEREIPDRTYVDLQCSYSFDAIADEGSVLRGTTLRAGAVNVLDADLAYSDVNIIGYDPSQADVRGRFLYVGVSKHF